MRAIFISYRREDVEGHARSLFQDLTAEFGKDKVFMDVAGIEPGLDFRRVIDQQVASCEVLLAMIGKDWLDAKDESGRRRLDQPADFVRLETASALKRDIPVVPVLVHGAKMPQADDLPDDLKDLAYRNAVELTHARWDSDVRVLMDALRPHVVDATQQSGGTNAPSASSVAPTRRAENTSGAPGASTSATAITTPDPRPATTNRRPTAIITLLVLVVLAAGFVAYKKVTGVRTGPTESAVVPAAAGPTTTTPSPAAPSPAVSAAAGQAAPDPAVPAATQQRPQIGPRGPAGPTVPATFSQGQLTVRGTGTFNLDVGAAGQLPADFFWEQRTPVKRFLVPRNGAAFRVVGQGDLESVSYADLQGYTLSREPIDGSEGRENQLPRGTVVAYRTKQGRLGKLRIMQYGYDLVIHWRTYAEN
jgi:hypothetical protein